jgi:hypothetical protein
VNPRIGFQLLLSFTHPSILYTSLAEMAISTPFFACLCFLCVSVFTGITYPVLYRAVYRLSAKLNSNHVFESMKVDLPVHSPIEILMSADFRRIIVRSQTWQDCLSRMTTGFGLMLAQGGSSGRHYAYLIIQHVRVNNMTTVYSEEILFPSVRSPAGPRDSTTPRAPLAGSAVHLRLH